MDTICYLTSPSVPACRSRKLPPPTRCVRSGCCRPQGRPSGRKGRSDHQLRDLGACRQAQGSNQDRRDVVRREQPISSNALTFGLLHDALHRRLRASRKQADHANAVLVNLLAERVGGGPQGVLGRSINCRSGSRSQAAGRRVDKTTSPRPARKALRQAAVSSIGAWTFTIAAVLQSASVVAATGPLRNRAALCTSRRSEDGAAWASFSTPALPARSAVTISASIPASRAVS